MNSQRSDAKKNDLIEKKNELKKEKIDISEVIKRNEITNNSLKK